MTTNIKHELTPIVLVLLSFIPLMVIGYILDVVLIHFFSQAQGNTAGFNSASLWVYNNLAGYRFLPQEIMTGFWLFMVLFFILNFFRSSDSQQFRIRFLLSFLFIWGSALTAAGCIVFACIQPFDLLLARLEDIPPFGKAIQNVLIAELLMIPLLPAAFFLFRKIRPVKASPPTQ